MQQYGLHARALLASSSLGESRASKKAHCGPLSVFSQRSHGTEKLRSNDVPSSVQNSDTHSNFRSTQP
eukprot:6421476-Amphidinium_carterae.1